MNLNSQPLHRILITGGAGMLGSAIFPASKVRSNHVLVTDIQTDEPSVEYLDVRDEQACSQLFSNFNPTTVLHLAALTDLEYCENNPHDAHATNAKGTYHIAKLCREHNARFAYISTAGVFDGKKDYYTENDFPNPINVYGKTKYEGEKLALTYCPDVYIFRAGWMMGGGPQKDKKFINKLFQQILSGQREIYAVTDKTGAPTYTTDFAHSLFRVMENLKPGLYHQVCLGNCTRYDVAKAFLENLGLDSEIRLHAVKSDFFKEEYFALRPSSESLINQNLELAGFNTMRSWQQCLTEYSCVYKNNVPGD